MRKSLSYIIYHGIADDKPESEERKLEDGVKLEDSQLDEAAGGKVTYAKDGNDARCHENIHYHHPDDCCDQCGSLNVTRTARHGLMDHYKCLDCGNTWKHIYLTA